MRTRSFHSWLLVVGVGLTVSPPAPAQTAPAQLAARAHEILHKHCFDCHGKDPKKLKGDLNLFDRTHLLDKERKVVVPKAPDDSGLIEQVEKDLMPPGKRPPVTPEERKVLREWVTAGAPAFPTTAEKPPEAETPKAVT